VGVASAEARVVDLGPRGVIATGRPFLDHMVDQLTAHAQLGVSVQVSVEGGEPPCEPGRDSSSDASDPDAYAAAGLALGRALGAAFEPAVAAAPSPESLRATFCAPLDEAYSECRLDLGTAAGELELSLAPYGKGAGRERIGTYQTALTGAFLEGVVEGAGWRVGLWKRRGDNAHHIVEASFKAFARGLRAALDAAAGGAPSPEPAPGGTRRASKSRSTAETSVSVELDLDGEGGGARTGIGTLDAMLDAVREEAGVALVVEASGDLWIDDHHTAEDVAITVGQCIGEALGDKRGVNRMGRAEAAVGGAQVEVVMDLSNRPYLGNGLDIDGVDRVGDLSVEMVDHLYLSMVFNAGMTVHIVKHAGEDGEELAMASARAFGRCLKQCAAVDPRRAGQVASSKGTLSV